MFNMKARKPSRHARGQWTFPQRGARACVRAYAQHHAPKPDATRWLWSYPAATAAAKDVLCVRRGKDTARAERMVVLRHLRVSVTHPPTATAQPAAAAMPGRRCPFSLETDFRAASFNPPHRTRVRQGMLRCRIRPRCCVSHLPSVHGDDVVHLVGALARTLGVEGVVETRLVERGDLGLHSSTQQHRHVRKPATNSPSVPRPILHPGTHARCSQARPLPRKLFAARRPRRPEPGGTAYVAQRCSRCSHGRTTEASSSLLSPFPSPLIIWPSTPESSSTHYRFNPRAASLPHPSLPRAGRPRRSRTVQS